MTHPIDNTSSSLRGLAAVTVIVSLAITPALVRAAPAVDASASVDERQERQEPDTPDPDILEARQLFDAGVTRYTGAEYGEAVSLWLEAYNLIPPTFENRLIKAELIYNVARAQQKWFEIDKDVQHLRQSREILDRYLGEVDELYGSQAAIEREKIQDQIDEVDEQIAAWEADQARREAELAERMRPRFDEEADAREARRNKAMIGAGAGLTTIGLGGVGMLVTGIILANAAQTASSTLPLQADIPAREAAIARGNAGNALVVTGTLAAGVFLAAGVPLLAVGAASEKKRKRRRGDVGGDVGGDMGAVAPLWIRGGAGLVIGGRF